MDLSFDVILGAWIATGLTLFILSFLYEDNPLFKLAEHLYVGVSLGYTIVKTYDTVVMTLILRPILEKGEWSLLIPVAIGMLMLTRYVPKAAWLSRYAFAFIVGIGAGLAIPRTISSFILKQIEDTVRPLLAVAPGGLPFVFTGRRIGNAPAPANTASAPSASSMRSASFHFARRSLRANDPTLSCPAFQPTARCATMTSSLSPERAETIVPKP